ncbi:alcohol dehydrogenase [Aspergillus clavatus NRRL 1]|uniref:Alcohol dehydrogenase patD n=1 Tax=Aspergillus clavatus (strain ATCC 1007 / CBS 513.65 / DSM 816 / NCTC 3887 / NRRL 1 / QM 1276 / 107) TaxID=344612 RepID=PATD_ASPCL|nr:alcohol dehydrogenase [Aspergillus clavatus NRRL 1]A1CFL1.1 RecName: Full=Alcohol dehydrogenase patD; AltName: Full=Patulin synthesis protein D [Aspergillus clavatus NRRL 1]EAW11660.1 alcohol dehydrogenase [Aspergillus clavatus NRRL 1]
MGSTLPTTYKRAFFEKQDATLTLEEVQLIEPQRGEILVKVEACGVCHSDHFAQMNLMGGGFPRVPGHEVVGRVAAVGDGETYWKIGDRTGAGWHGGHDGTCGACKKGLFQMCDNEQVNGITRDGGYAEYVLIRSEAAVRIPDHVNAAKYAPMLCAGVTVFNSIRQMNIPVGETVVIQGLGGLGHLALQYANRFGYRVVALSRGAQKEEFARKLGAHVYIDTSKEDPVAALQKLGGAALIVSTAPSPELINPLIEGLGVLGKLLILSIVGGIEVHTGLLVSERRIAIHRTNSIVRSLLTNSKVGKGKSIWSWPSGHATDSEEAIAFAELQGIDCLVEEFPLEKCNEAFGRSSSTTADRERVFLADFTGLTTTAAMMDGSVRFRAVITME